MQHLEAEASAETVVSVESLAWVGTVARPGTEVIGASKAFVAFAVCLETVVFEREMKEVVPAAMFLLVRLAGSSILVIAVVLAMQEN